MGKEFHLPKLGVKIEKNDIQNKIEDTYDELSCLGMQDKEIRELQEQHLHDTKRMNQIIKSQKIKLSTDPTLITYRVLLLKEFQPLKSIPKGEFLYPLFWNNIEILIDKSIQYKIDLLDKHLLYKRSEDHTYI